MQQSKVALVVDGDGVVLVCRAQRGEDLLSVRLTADVEGHVDPRGTEGGHASALVTHIHPVHTNGTNKQTTESKKASTIVTHTKQRIKM